MGRCACERCVLVCAYVHGAACPRGGCRLSPSRPVRSVMAADLGFLLSCCCSVVRLSSNSRRLRHWWMKWLSLSWTRSGSSDTTTHAHGRYRSSRNLRQEQPHNTIRTTTVSRSKQHDHATAVATPRTAHTHARQRTAVGREVEGRNVVQRCFRGRPVTEDG